jgi:hypothetical protein
MVFSLANRVLKNMRFFCFEKNHVIFSTRTKIDEIGHLVETFYNLDISASTGSKCDQKYGVRNYDIDLVRLILYVITIRQI